jgi:hypothetical protein
MILKKTFPVNKLSAYELTITLDNVTEYKKGIIKIINDVSGQAVFLPIKLPNIIFSKSNSNPNSKEYVIYFDTPDDDSISSVSMYILGLDIASITINLISFDQMMSKINFIRLRQLNEIEFTKYYLDLYLMYSAKKVDAKLIQKINEEYALFKNSNYYDSVIDDLIDNNQEVESLDKHKDMLQGMYGDKQAILFLTSTIHDESNASQRIKAIAKTINYDNSKYYGILCTRYGYPYDHSEDYYSKKMALGRIDNVNYIPLWNGKDNYFSNTLCSYIDKYIIELTKVCKTNSISILHVQNDYINGFVAGYVAKKLGIKFIYDININKWSKISTEDMNSDMSMLKINLEKKAITMADKIIITPFCYDIYSQILQFNEDADSNLLLLPASIDTNKYKDNKDNITKIKEIIQTISSTHAKQITNLRSETSSMASKASQKSNIIYNSNRSNTSRVFLGNGITYNQSAGFRGIGCGSSSGSGSGSRVGICAYSPNSNAYESNLSGNKKYAYDETYDQIYGMQGVSKQKIIHRPKVEINKPCVLASSTNKLIIGYLGPITSGRGIEELINNISSICKDHHIAATCVLINDWSSITSSTTTTEEPVTIDESFIKTLLSLIISLNLEKNVTLVTDVSEHLKWAYVDYVNVFYYSNCKKSIGNAIEDYDYDLTFQKLISKGKQIIVTEEINKSYPTSLNEITCISIKDSSESVAKLCQMVGSDSIKRNSISSNALRTYANTYFSIAAVCNKLYNIYNIKVDKKNDQDINNT